MDPVHSSPTWTFRHQKHPLDHSPIPGVGVKYQEPDVHTTPFGNILFEVIFVAF